MIGINSGKYFWNVMNICVNFLLCFVLLLVASSVFFFTCETYYLFPRFQIPVLIIIFASPVRSEFIFINPNSQGQCGCGESFMTTTSSGAAKPGNGWDWYAVRGGSTLMKPFFHDLFIWHTTTGFVSLPCESS